LLTALSLAVESAECKKALVKKFLDWIKLHENISELFAVVDFSYNEHAKHFKQGIFTKEEVITYVHNAIVNIAKNYQADEQNKIKSQSKNKSNMPSMQEAIKNNFIKFGLKVPCEETITAISDSEHLLAFCSLFSKGFIQSAGGIENFYKSIGDFDGFYQGFTRYNCKGDKGYNFILILLLSKIQIGYRWQFLEYLIDNVNALGNLAKLWDILFINNTKNQEEKKTILTFLLEDLIVYKDSDTLLAEKIHILLYERAMLAEFIERYGVEWLVNIYKLCEESKKQLVSYRVSLYGKHNMQCMRNAHKFFECIDRPLSEIYEYCYKHIRIILDTLIRNFTPEHKDELRDICNGVNSRDEVFTHQLQVNLIFYFYLKTQDKYLSLIKNMLNSTLEKIKKETCIKILYQVICKNEYGRAGDFITLYIKSMNASITCWSQDKDFIYKFILLYLRDVAFKKNNYQFSPFEKIIKNPVLLDVKMLLNLLRDLQKEDSEFRKQIEILLKKIRGMDLYPKFLAAVKMNLIQEISQVIQPCIHDNRIFSSTFKPGLAQKMEALLNAPGEDTLDFAIDLCCLFKDMKTPDSIQAIQKAQQFLKTYSEQKSYITTLENEVASNKFM